jgi:hypothetical protein
VSGGGGGGHSGEIDRCGVGMEVGGVTVEKLTL